MILAAGGRPGEGHYLLIGLTCEPGAAPRVIEGSQFPRSLWATPLKDVRIVVALGRSEEEVRSELAALRMLNIKNPLTVEDNRGGSGE